MSEMKAGVLRNIVNKYGSNYKIFFSLEATNSWGNASGNLLSNLINYSCPDNYRYWSKTQVNASIIISFTDMIRINSYALQAINATCINYPTSWEVYVTTKSDADDWQLVDYQKTNEYLNQQHAKRFFINQRKIKKFKIVQLSNSFSNCQNNYTNCLTLKRIELYESIIRMTCNSNKRMNILCLVIALLVC